MRFGYFIAAAAICVGLSVPATAQQTQLTDNKAVGNWLVRCFNVESPSPCDMIEFLANKDTNQRILSISISYVPNADRHTMQIAVPLGVSLAKGVVLTAGDYKSSVMKYRRCDSVGCYVEMVADDATINAFALNEEATVTFVGDDGKEIPLTIALNGFAAAHEQMKTWARQKAKNPPPSTPANP